MKNEMNLNFSNSKDISVKNLTQQINANNNPLTDKKLRKELFNYIDQLSKQEEILSDPVKSKQLSEIKSMKDEPKSDSKLIKILKSSGSWILDLASKAGKDILVSLVKGATGI